MYSAAAEGSPKYVPQVCIMDPVRLGGSQSRCRAYICFVRSDVHSRRGPLMVPTTCAPSQAPVPLLMLLDPVAEVAPMPSTYYRLAWTAADRCYDPDHHGPRLAYVSSVHSPFPMAKCFSVDGPSPALTSGQCWVCDPRVCVERHRLFSVPKMLRIQGLPGTTFLRLRLCPMLASSLAAVRRGGA
jgi:hypothetical protein